jgi:site-specific recombinase XerC
MSLPRGSSPALATPVAAVVASLHNAGRLTEQSEDRLLGLMTRFLSFVERGFGTPLAEVSREQVEAFVLAPSSDGRAPSVASSHLRRSAVRMLFRVLREHGVVEHDPTLDVRLPPRTSLQARPLCDDEIAVGRSFSFQTLRDSRQPAAWALAEATVRTSELSQVTIENLDLELGTVRIAGSTKTQARIGALTQWGVEALARRVESLGPIAPAGTLVVYEGDGSLESRQASCCVAISDTLRRAGLAEEPDVRPVSVAAWAGKKVFDETGRIEAVAQALGVRSLDRAARLIGWDWSNEDVSR